MPAYHLAQLNVAIPIAPVDSEQLAGFVAQLDPINALADDAPGFVWRLQTEDGNATAVRLPDRDGLLVNMSVWQSLDALAEFVYRSPHAAVMRRRREWFVPMREIYLVLWWIPAGTIPSVGEATGRLAELQANGPIPRAFTFRKPFPAPGASVPDTIPDEWSCPV